jgi:iron complex transport system substrate-binding protein
VSLLPGLTELVCALGLEDQLEGISHECDFPESVAKLPALTSTNYPSPDNLDSREIHESITQLLENALSIYSVDVDLLVDIQPDVILTQHQCEVCAVSYNDLMSAVNQALGSNTRIVSTSPTNLEEIYQSFTEVADALYVKQRGEALVNGIQKRFNEIQRTTQKLESPDVLAIEWLDPLMTGGNWMPEMIEIAGGVPHLAEAGKHSPWCEWDDVVSLDPDFILIVPCGYGIEKTLGEMSVLTEIEDWRELSAVQNDNVFILDGNQYFNRPGPRIRESVEILAEILHPEDFDTRFEQTGWVKYLGNNLKKASN